jgi:hypothetical protein
MNSKLVPSVELWLGMLPPGERLSRLAAVERRLRVLNLPVSQEALRAIALYRLKCQTSPGPHESQSPLPIS